jgi:hypothetical protein
MIAFNLIIAVLLIAFGGAAVGWHLYGNVFVNGFFASIHWPRLRLGQTAPFPSRFDSAQGKPGASA